MLISDPHDIPALIAALEAAAVGSQALDYEIARLVGWEPTACDMACGDDEPPEFSVNMHAALTLVPDAETVRVWLTIGAPGAWASIDPSVPHKAATPALAMCCAALRARSAG